MKNKLLISTVFSSLLFANSIYSQTDVLKEARQYLSVQSGAQNVDKKALKNPDPQAMACVELKFRSSSVGKIGTTSSYAILEGIDSALFQTITNEFYVIFSEKLKGAGITLVDLEKIKATKKYKEIVADTKEKRNYSSKETGAATIYTQNHDPIFAPTGMKLYKYQSEIEAGVTNLLLMVDFIEFDMTAKDVYHDFFDKSNKTSTVTAKVRPAIKITSGWAESSQEDKFGAVPGLTIVNKKMMGPLFSTTLPIYSPYEADVTTHDGSVPEFAKNRSRLFGGGPMQLGTFVVKPNQEAFHKSAIEALTRYAEYVAAIIKSYNEDKKK